MCDDDVAALVVDNGSYQPSFQPDPKPSKWINFAMD